MINQEREKRAAEGPKLFNRRSKAKRDLRVKMGHGGTLDPLASGVLILGLGSGTKSLQSFLDCTKTYETIVLFGASTDTYDRVGRILTRRSYAHITKDMVLEALGSFRGKIKQIPPLYSALKMEGKPLYEYAREGKPIPREIPTREVEVQALELVEWYEPGTHSHRWPTEEAEDAERQLAERVWKQQENRKSLTPEEEKEEAEALAAHEAVKRKHESDVDSLVRDRPPSKRQKKMNNRNPRNEKEVLMSGALGQPSNNNSDNSNSNKGSNLIPPTDPNAPPPWKGEGPAAVKIRMTVTSGFYVRSFCHDLGVKVNSAAMMAELCRSRQGAFEVGGPNCLEYSDIEKGEEVWAPKVAKMLANWAERGNAPVDAAPLVVDPVQVSNEVAAEKARESSTGPDAPLPLPADAETVPQSVESEEVAVQASASNGVEVEGLAPPKKDDDEVSWNGFQD